MQALSQLSYGPEPGRGIARNHSTPRAVYLGPEIAMRKQIFSASRRLGFALAVHAQMPGDPPGSALVPKLASKAGLQIPRPKVARPTIGPQQPAR